jgi:signal transduction histidine kinase
VRRDLSQLIDAAVLLFVGAIVVVGAGLRAAPSNRPLAVTLAVVAAGMLVFRRRAPAVTLAVSGGIVLALFAVDHAAGTIAVVAPAAALYSLALVRGRGHIVVGAVAAAAAVILADVFLAGGHGHGHGLTLQTLGHAALVAIPVLAAEAFRNHRSYVRLLLDRLELAERTREEEARRRAEQERLRIARELHDVVAHTLTTINVQAGVARHLLKRQPDHAEGALGMIESASHDALQELRAILGVLREPGEEGAPLEPAPGLAAVEALIEGARSSGGEIDFQVEGTPPERVPDAVQLAAFRIIQESLTNTRRHAPGAPASVAIAYGSDRLQLTVENTTVNRRNGSRREAGTGIRGMRERATALGGTLEAESGGGRFRIAAELPYRMTR